MSQTLQEFLNKDLITAGLVDDTSTSLDAIREDSAQIISNEDLKDYAMQCQSAFLNILRNPEVFVVREGSTPARIDINRGGGTFMYRFERGEELQRFSSRHVFNFTIYTDAGYVFMYEILSGAVGLVDKAGNPATQVITDLRTIARYYRHAFERVLLPERVANRQEAELARFRADLNAENVADVNHTVTGYWSIMGWLTKNIRQIKAKIPERGDFLDVFLQYNPNAVEGEGYEIHQDGLTSGGFANQFTYMFLISFTNRVKMPRAVEEWLSDFGSQVKNPMSCNRLALLLINRYGFKFGITDKATVARTCLTYAETDRDVAEFFRGYGAGAEELANRIGRAIPNRAEDFNPEVEAEVNPLNQEFPDSEM